MKDIEAISEAIKLLKAIGGNKDMQKLLENMEKAQEYNEQLQAKVLLAQTSARQDQEKANATLALANTTKTQSDNALINLRAETERSRKLLLASEASVISKSADLDRRTTEQTEVLKQRENDLIKRTVVMDRRETAIKEKESKQELITQELANIEKIVSRISAI